jgi:hypothetical protein
LAKGPLSGRSGEEDNELVQKNVSLNLPDGC